MDIVAICNLALARLGEDAITSLDQNSKPARACKRFYEPIRDEVLRAHQWNFAAARSTLSALSTAPAFGWAYQYQLPADFLAMVTLNQWDACDAVDHWEIEGDKLLTNAEIAQVKYIRRVEDATLFDPSFIGALKVRLAAEMAHLVTGNTTHGEQLMREYLGILKPLAQSVDASEGKPEVIPAYVDSDLVNSRYTGI